MMSAAIHVRILRPFLRCELGEPMVELHVVVPFQLPATPMRFFPIGIEDTDGVTVNRLEGGDPRKLNRAAVLRPRPSAYLSRRQDGRHVVFGFGNGLAEMGDSIAQSASTNGSAKR